MDLQAQPPVGMVEDIADGSAEKGAVELCVTRVTGLQAVNLGFKKLLIWFHVLALKDNL